MIKRLNYLEINAKATNGLAAASKHITSIDSKLRAMVEVRVSQINGCVYCVDLHVNQARDAGETQQRLDCLAVWRECPFFEDSERSALAWAEAVTLLPETTAPDDLYDGLKAHFSERQIVDLTLIISLMNAWNRLAVGFRHLPDARG
jgi:AhpD family alkylhydroperoxidase